MKKKLHHWNYRIITEVFSYEKTFKKTNEKLASFPNERLFSIVEVHYNKKGKPLTYAEKHHLLGDCTSIEDLNWTYKKIKKAYKLPVLDADNWPHEWESGRPKYLPEPKVKLPKVDPKKVIKSFPI